ncbi:MAG: DNA repair protein RecN [Pseudomonadota bacterium]
MLARLSIRDIVIIDRLDLEFGPGFGVLTGETGAGKSILLDALSLALGARGDASLVRAGAERGQVFAEFDLSPQHPAFDLLREQGLDAEPPLILRRVQSADGRTRGFANDQPVSVLILREIGQLLVEIHGQHDERALVDAATHRGLVDAYGGLDPLLQATREAHAALSGARRDHQEAETQLEEARRDADYLQHTSDELDKLAPEPGEEERLAETRQRLMTAEKIAGDLKDAVEAVGGEQTPVQQISAVLRRLERRSDDPGGMVAPLANALSSALDALGHAREVAENTLREAAFDPLELERTEERLFALRALARKHAVTVEQLPALREQLHGKLVALSEGEARLAALADAVKKVQSDYRTAAIALSKARAKSATALAKAVNGELPALKLERAHFSIEIETEDPEATASADGVDRIVFHVQTNPGSAPGPLMKVASGGELSRFLLAIKVALAGRGSAPTLVFDEIDTAVSGAVSEAIGARLQRLSEGGQVLSVTHSPQVAARAGRHFLIAKSDAAPQRVATQVTLLEDDARHEEIARMLAGATISDEARAAAGRLIAEAR